MKIELTDKAAADLLIICDGALKGSGLQCLNCINEIVPQLMEHQEELAKKNGKEPVK